MSEGFQGNKNVKAGGTKTAYTKEQIVEYAKCAEDPCYFIENYVKVISLDAGVVPFKLRPYQRRIVDTVHNNRFTIGMLFRQSGKALPLDTPIPTPNGFVPMKDIHVGDVVFGNDGLPTTVTAESEVKPLTMYRITFDTGESVVACKDHLWEVYDRYNSREKVAPNKYTHKRMVVTTEELSRLKWKVVNKRGKNQYSYYIPNTKPVQYEKKDVRIEPYLLGVWLGAGTSTKNCFTFERKNYEFFKANGVTAVNLGEGARKKNTNVYTSRIAELSMADLRHYGLVKHKHIPTDYLFSSVEQRLALLQGIMDTDGSIGKTGVCELSFSEKYPYLLDTVETLLHSLGLKVRKEYRASTRSYRFSFYCSIDTFPMFRIPYKLERQKPRTKYLRYTSSRSIVNIERLEGEQLGKCIQVTNEQRMYLCGKNYLPTHNSTIMAAYCLWYITFNDHKTAAILANKKAQAIEIFSRMQYMYELLPDFLKPGVIEWNKTSCTLDSGSKCFCAASSSSSIRGRSINLLLLDEFAYLQSGIAEDFIASVFPTLTSSRESKLVLISCVTKDTMVFGKDGIKTVGEFVDETKNGGYFVPEYSVLGKGKFNQGSIMYNNGRVPTKIIRSTHSELECSHEHKLWANVDGEFGWYKASELKVGDWVSIQYGMEIWGSNDSIGFDYTPYESISCNKIYRFDKITPDLAYLLGLYIAEGYIDKYRINIACGDDISDIFKRLGLKYACRDGLHYTVCSLSLCDMIRHLGFDTTKKAKEKEIPRRLMSMSRENIIAMLQGMFDGDGCATLRGTVSYTSTSKKLVDQVRMLLNNFGILTECHHKIARPTKRVKVSSELWTIELSKQNSRAFFDKIGFRLPRKQNRQSILDKYTFSKNHYDVVPSSVNLVRDHYHLTTRCGITTNPTKTEIQRRKLLEIKDIIDDDYWNDYYEKAVSPNIYWERILEIKDSENEVYDFSLNDVDGDPFCHSVIYNGYIGHQTPNGLNQFYRIWKDSENGKNDFVRVRGYWNEIYDQKWYEEQCRLLNNDKAKISSELDCIFLGSAQTLIDSNKIQCLVGENPIYEANNLRIYEAPKDGHSYFMTVDVSRGRGLDYSAVIVFDVTAMPFRVVATYKDNNVSPMELPTLIHQLGTRYNEALVMIEANDLGESVANELWWTLEYPGVLHTKDGKIGGAGILGVKTTKGVKSRGCAKVKELIENDQLIVSDSRIIEELEGYVLGKRGTYEAQNTKINDDLCACLFLFGWCCESNYFQDYAKTDVSRTLIDRYKADVEDTMPTFGCMSDGGDDPMERYRLDKETVEMLQ